jgi:hypothetical protein
MLGISPARVGREYWYMPAVPSPGRKRQEDLNFQPEATYWHPVSIKTKQQPQ